MSQKSSNRNNSQKEFDTDIINGIVSHDERMIFKLYQDYYPRIKKLVYSFRNTILDPEDIFQEGFTLTIFNIRTGKFRGESTVFTYLNKICYNLCLKQLAIQKKTRIHESDALFEAEDANIDILNRIMNLRTKLSPKCVEIIDLRFGLKSESLIIVETAGQKMMAFEEIAKRMELEPSNARQRFKRCLDQLKEFVRLDSILKQHFDV